MLILIILDKVNGSLWSYKRKGESPRSRLPEEWMLVVCLGGRTSRSPLGPQSHMIPMNHYVYLKLTIFRGRRDCKIIFAPDVTLGNMSKYQEMDHMWSFVK